jgi:hypothetical protein
MHAMPCRRSSGRPSIGIGKSNFFSRLKFRGGVACVNQQGWGFVDNSVPTGEITGSLCESACRAMALASGNTQAWLLPDIATTLCRWRMTDATVIAFE